MPLALKEAWQEVMQPVLDRLIADLTAKAQAWKLVPMLARTHGQPASPTRLGKELQVFIERRCPACHMILADWSGDYEVKERR